MPNGVMSNKTIEKNMTKNIFIYPYSPSKMDGGSTYNLSSSIVAYYNADENSQKTFIYAVEKRNGKSFIVIPPHKTVFIQTEECVYVTNCICGTYHSKVRLASLGLSHIGTTLDPEYFGTSLLSVQNTSEEDISIEVGKSFVSLMFYRMMDKAIPKHDNAPGRSDISTISSKNTSLPDGSPLTEDVANDIEEWYSTHWRKSISALQSSCQKAYNETTIGKRKRNLRIAEFWITLAIYIIALAFSIANLYFSYKNSNNQDIDFFSLIMAIGSAILAIKTVVFSFLSNKMEV